MMNVLSLLLYMFSVAIALLTLYLCFCLYRKFQFRFLLNYLYFLTAFFMAGFIDLVGRYLALRLLSGQPEETVMLLNHIFIFLMFPFVPWAIYLYVSFIKDFLQKKISPLWTWAYSAFWAFFFLILVLAAKSFLSNQSARFSSVMFSVLDWTTFIFYLLISAFLLFKSKNIKDINRKRTVRFFSVFYLLGFAFTFISSEIGIIPALGQHMFTILLYFSLNLAPLLYLRYYLRKYQPEPYSLQLIPETDLEGVCKKYGMSKREKEIIHLMLRAKSNKEITQELFISLHTVKNHIYNIYQKLGVKNRLQLVRLIQTDLQNKINS